MTGSAPSFAQQRLVCVMLLVGMSLYTIAVAIVLQTNEGKGLASTPITALDDAVMFVGLGLAIAAFVIRPRLQQAAAKAAPAEQGRLRFAAMLVPLAMLEGGCLFGITTWLLNGNAVPGLAVGLVLFALAIVMVPFSDPDQAR